MELKRHVLIVKGTFRRMSKGGGAVHVVLRVKIYRYTL